MSPRRDENEAIATFLRDLRLDVNPLTFQTRRDEGLGTSAPDLELGGAIYWPNQKESDGVPYGKVEQRHEVGVTMGTLGRGTQEGTHLVEIPKRPHSRLLSAQHRS